MGNENNSGIKESFSRGFDSKLILSEVDRFYTSELTKQQFVGQLFSEIDNAVHPMVGKISICNTFIMERFFQVMVQSNRGTTVNTDNLKTLIDKMYKKPEKAIQKSFALIDLDNDKYITDAEFLSFVDNCFISLMTIAEAKIQDKKFKLALREWVMKNKKTFYDGVLTEFNKNKKTDPNKWMYADFKRWIISGKHWTLDISLGPHKFRTPLNLLCLFGIPLGNDTV